MEEVLEEIKRSPGQLKYSSVGPGTVQNIGIQLLLQEAGFSSDSVIQIPFDSGGAAAISLVGKHVDIHQTNLSPVLSHIKGGKLRALAVTTTKRVNELPNVPTFSELGFPGVDIVGWRGVAGPPKLPNNVIKAWAEALKKTVKDKAWRNMVNRLGDEIAFMPTGEFSEFVKKEFNRYRSMANKLGILVK